MAGRYPPAWLDELRARADIVQVVSGYVQLKRNGANYWGLCPFHGEKTASFSVNPGKQFYYCFGCKAGGSVINFIMEIERLDFGEAVKLLADRVHLPLPEMELDADYQRRQSQKARLLAANTEAARYYHQLLYTDAGRPALDYLKGRGLSDGVIRRFGLGAAPDNHGQLTRHLTELGFTQEELVLANLTRVYPAREATETSPALPRAVRDNFHDRAMFPIIDAHGSVIAFGGRVLGKGEPKYLNSSDTPVFNKRLGVYAANLLHRERQLERVILVEGYMDVVALTQFGVRGVCATLGTALTPEQARLLKRYAPVVYLAYDGDSAGQHAIMRGLDILAAEGVPARVLDFPDGLDPDEFIRRDGLQGFERLPALTPATYRLRRLKAEQNMSTQDGRMAYARAAMRILQPLDPVERETQLDTIALESGFSKDVLRQQLAQTPGDGGTDRRGQTGASPAAADSPAEVRPARIRPQRELSAEQLADLRAQEGLISILASGQVPADITRPEVFTDDLLKNLYLGLCEGQSVAALIESQPTGEDQARAARLLDDTPADSRDELLQMAQDCLRVIRKTHIQERIDQLKEQIRTLSGDERAAAVKEVLALQNAQRIDG